jgi:hypothetical protein
MHHLLLYRKLICYKLWQTKPFFSALNRGKGKSRFTFLRNLNVAAGKAGL